MSKVRFEFNERGLEQIAQNAVEKFASQHQNECIICHKPIEGDEHPKPGMVPVHRECAEKKGLI
jgi:hypothetical protein